jgi:hypothetical protein
MTAPRLPLPVRPALALGIAAALLAGCGGGSPFDNPPVVDNPVASSGRKLSFAYYQRCIEPIFVTRLPVLLNGVRTENTCAASGCHDDRNGTGGALRLSAEARTVDLRDPALTAEAIRATAMYRNFYSAQGESIPGQPLASRLLTKPLLLNVLHGGGQVFDSQQDVLVRRIAYWISRPMPDGQDEFSTAGWGLFSPADPMTGACDAP